MVKGDNMTKFKYINLKNSSVAIAIMFLASSCAQQSSVTHAPHRTEASSMQVATVVSSYPVRVTKNSGVGAMAAGLGGSAVGYKNVGSGTGRIVGSMLGSIVGGITGRAAESKIRETAAQEVTIKLNNQTHTLISKNLPLLKSGDSVMAYTNVYGKPLSIKPVRQE